MEWIKCSERMPEFAQDVFCFNLYKQYMIGSVTKINNDNYVCEGYFAKLFSVTHWMPLPEPPKE
jgi:hypothetical protein